MIEKFESILDSSVDDLVDHVVRDVGYRGDRESCFIRDGFNGVDYMISIDDVIRSTVKRIRVALDSCKEESVKEELEIGDLGYVEEMRMRLGLSGGDQSKDDYILSLSAMDRVKLVVGWYHGDGEWAEEYKSYFESQGIYLTEDSGAKGII